MEINDMIDFHALILSSGIGYQESMPSLKALGDCIHHYSTMCDCEGEVKQNKRNECQLRYENLIKNQMNEVAEKLLEYESNYVFKSNGETIGTLSQFT